jgi:hypothetical protein
VEADIEMAGGVTEGAKPAGSPVYHGYVVVPETYIDGWVLGEVTPFLREQSGDGFVVAPDGTQASLVWEVGAVDVAEIMPATPQKWGVYAVAFPEPMKNTKDLVSNFRAVLPALQAAHARARAGS